ncbi:helix-turn-helix transcriptional regulator [Paenibacillus campi]|uniref:helix-turn-helix transcriptional regulator n=1 Tax=Paenibacillus campi TaxID=3106031 RepID=UPI002AFE6D76|nr:helix-turn-helix transcriptional regulator [Paenibacillus sp. SGZ-1014]
MAVMSPKAERKREPYTKIKMFLMENNISQKQLGEAIGKGTSAINQKINGTGGDFSLAEARVLCKEFGLPKEYFFEIKVPKSEQKEGTVSNAG